MSQENVELVRASRRPHEPRPMSQMSDVEIRSFFHPDVEFLPRRAATEGAYHGIAGIERFIADNEAASRSSSRTTSFSIWASGCSRGARSVYGRDRVASRRTSQSEASVEFRDGKIVRWQDFGSKDEALKAVGLEE